MKTKFNLSITLGISIFTLFLFSCESEITNEELVSPSELQMIYYFDEGGKLVPLNSKDPEINLNDFTSVEGKKNTTISGKLNPEAITHLNGLIETDFRGKLQITYNNGSGSVRWDLREDVSFTGDIYCLTQVRDQIIIGIEITKSTSGETFAPGQRIVTTVKDLGNPGSDNKDQLAKILLVNARPGECYDEILPDINDLLGFDNSNKGNIVAK